MNPHGNHLIGGLVSAEGREEFRGINPRTGRKLEPPFVEATQAEIDRSLGVAVEAQSALRNTPAEGRAVFLEAIATAIEGLGDDLLARGEAETALPLPRLTMPS